MKYKLKREMVGLSAGVIFEHRDYDEEFPDRGNYGAGVMILAWVDGNCQADWAGESFILPGQLANDKRWFEPVEQTKEGLIEEIEKLKEKVQNFCF